ncbi:hypothetical protein PM082_000546 [Marasmius tenuissimus]|nr:hypothetical protein PM082_000546 [Marasmius tenuissimus]
MKLFIYVYLELHAQVIMDMINSFLEDLRSGEGVDLTSVDLQHIIKGTKYPIILCNFATPSLSKPRSCVTIWDPVMMEENEGLYKQGAAAAVSKLMENWQETVNDGDVLAIALFARAQGRDLVVANCSTFPLSGMAPWNPVFGDEENVVD